MTPRIVPELERRMNGRHESSYAEFRSRTAASTPIGDSRYASVFWKYVTAAPPPGFASSDLSRSEWLEAEGIGTAEHRVLSKASSSAGGYLVPTDLEQQIVSALRARSAMARVSRVLETETGVTMLAPSTTTHGVAAWTAENASYSASDETFGQVSIGGFKAGTKVIVSEELAADAGIAFDEYLAEELGARLGVLAETAYVLGDGSGKPLGIAHASSGVTAVTAATGSTTNFTPADIAVAYKALPAAYRARATWLLNADVFANMATRTDSAGAFVFSSLHADPPSLMGRPVEISADLATPAASARSAVFADFQSAYTVRIVRGAGIQRQDEIHSDSGQLGYRAFLRTDGRVVLADAARILAHSAT